MPRRTRRSNVRRPRKMRRRTTMRTRRRGNKSTLRNSRPSAIISDRFITKMKYADRITFTTGAAGGSNCVLFNLNSTYDPDRTNIGHQPWGRDQLAALYHRYRVFAVSWRVSFFPMASPASLFVAPINSEVSIGGNPLSHTRETPRSIVKLASPDRATVFVGRIGLAKLNGQTSAEYKAGDRFQALSGADPAELMTLQIGGNPVTSVVTTYNADVQLTYHVEWFDPIPVAQS